MSEEYFSNEMFYNIWKDRYQKNNETLDENFRRVAKYVANDDKEAQEFYDVMKKGLFFPAGRTMSNAGIGSNLTLNNCFVAPQIRDDLVSIFESVTLGAKTHQRGGGIGYDFSNLRPAGTPTSNDAIASGALSFMDVFNAQTATILQGNRRGANMGVMNVYAMDIEDFITAKSKDPNKLNHFNLSVMVDDDFMLAVESDEDVYLHFPVYTDSGRIEKNPSHWKYSKKKKARELWDLITRMAYENGEPGVFFYDTMNKDNTLWYMENIVCSNPCAEYLAGTVYNGDLCRDQYGGACNLGSLMLHRFVNNPFTKEAFFDSPLLYKTIYTAVCMLDNIIDINKFPDDIYKNYQESFRTIGLGVTGLGDMLVMLGYRYDSEEACNFVDNLMDQIAYYSYYSSYLIAMSKGSFKYFKADEFMSSGYMLKHDDYKWDHLKNDIIEYKSLRNARMISVAPCGTMSLTFGNNCSSGIEPIFSLEYERKVKFGGQDESNTSTIVIRDYAYDQWLKFKDDPRCIVTKDMFVTALDMDVDAHVNMLAAVAKHADMSVSKTINIPEDYSFEDTQEVFKKVHKLGIKGCTIFRPNSIRQGVLVSGSNAKTVEISKSTSLPRGFIVDASDDLVGKKRKLITGCGSLHCEAFFDPDSGDLMEVFLSKGSTGGCLSNQTGLSRMISLALRSGCTVHDIINQLKSCPVCPSYAIRQATKHDASAGNCCPSAVANALLNMWNEMQKEIGEDSEESNGSKHIITSVDKCPECGAELIHNGGCVECKSCGYSKCG